MGVLGDSHMAVTLWPCGGAALPLQAIVLLPSHELMWGHDSNDTSQRQSNQTSFFMDFVFVNLPTCKSL